MGRFKGKWAPLSLCTTCVVQSCRCPVEARLGYPGTFAFCFLWFARGGAFSWVSPVSLGFLPLAPWKYKGPWISPATGFVPSSPAADPTYVNIYHLAPRVSLVSLVSLSLSADLWGPGVGLVSPFSGVFCPPLDGPERC